MLSISSYLYQFNSHLSIHRTIGISFQNLFDSVSILKLFSFTQTCVSSISKFDIYFKSYITNHVTEEDCSNYCLYSSALSFYWHFESNWKIQSILLFLKVILLWLLKLSYSEQVRSPSFNNELSEIHCCLHTTIVFQHSLHPS